MSRLDHLGWTVAIIALLAVVLLGSHLFYQWKEQDCIARGGAEIIGREAYCITGDGRLLP